MSGKGFLFNKRRYRILFLSIFIIALGFIIMSGGESSDPDIFNEEIYSFRRIRIAPLIVIIGFAIEIYAILTKPE